MSSSSSEYKSPRRTPYKQAPTPTRLTREGECKELHDLNQRLEYYILKNRTKDANRQVLEREIDALRDHYNEEMQHAQELFAEQLDEARKSRDNEAAEASRLRAENARLKKELEHTGFELDQLRESEARLRQENEDLHTDNNNKSLELMRLRQESQDARTQADLLGRKNDHLEEEVKDAQHAAQEAQAQLIEAQSHAQALEEDFALYREKAEAELKRYREQTNDLTKSQAAVEDELREEFSTQVAELISQRQEEFDREKDEALAELKAIYDEKIAAYRDHLERAGHEMELLKQQKQESDTLASEARTIQEEMQQMKVVMKKKVTELEQELKQERGRPSQQLAEKNEIIRRLKAAFKRKDEEFDELMDVKISLAMEIKAYRAMIEREEQRLGYQSPSHKKRKRTLENGETDAAEDEDMEGADEQSNPLEDHGDGDDTLLISGMDLEGRYLNIRNGSTTEINLAGWCLQSRSNEFKFPIDITLRPGDTITVVTGPDAASQHNPPAQVAWITDDEEVFDEAGDECVLMNPDAYVVSQVEIIPTKPDLGTSHGDEDGDASMSDAQGQKECTIM